MTTGSSPENASGSATPRSGWQLLRDSSFLPFIVGNLLSNLGTWIHSIAAAIVVFDLTGSALMVGALVAAQFGPAMVLSPWAGAVSDRRSRRRILIASQLLGASSAGALAMWAVAVGPTGLPGPWPIVGASFLMGLGSAFSIPAGQALLPALVPRADIDQAVALHTATFMLGRAVGPALGGGVFVLVGAGAAFGLNSASYLAYAIAVIIVRLLETEAGQKGRVRFWDGLRFVWGDRILMVTLLAMTALAFGADPVQTLAPPLAEILRGGDALVGVIASAFGAGALVTAILLRQIGRHLTTESRAWIGLIVLGVGTLALSVSPSPTPALAALTVSGSGFVLALSSLTAGIYLRVPNALRGRVMALWGIAFLGSRPIASLVNGAIADLTSTRLAIAVAGAIAMAAGWLIQPSRQSLRGRRTTPLEWPGPPDKGGSNLPRG